MDRLSKYVVFVVSGGRTGTKFLGETLSSIIDDSYSVHEPDLFEGPTRNTLWKIRRFGLYHMVVGRVFGRTGIRNLTQRYLSGRISRDQLVLSLRMHRDRYYQKIREPLVIESYYQWFGVLPAVPELCKNYRVVGVVRDPRTWVASCLNFGSHHGWSDWVKMLGFRRLDPEMIGDKDFAPLWNDMSAFERNCWDWKTIYSTISVNLKRVKHFRLFRYEDLFLAEDRTAYFEDMLAFITQFPDRAFAYRFDESVLNERINPASRDTFPDWQEWDKTQARRLHEICGPLMAEFGYGTEPEWQELIA